MWGLVYHGCAFDVADLLHGRFLLGLGEAVDVVEDVGWFLDAEGGSHFGEHVVLWFAFLGRVG